MTDTTPRIPTDTERALKSNASLAVFEMFSGILLALVAAFFLYLAFFSRYSESSRYYLIGISAIIGIFSLIILGIGGNRQDKITQFPKIYEAIRSVPDGKINAIAKKLGMDRETFSLTLTDLIESGILPYAYIDRRRDAVIVGFIDHLDELVCPPPEEPEKPERVTVKCPGCGAVMSMNVGDVQECESCGRLVEGY
jgi:hypothetical protein